MAEQGAAKQLARKRSRTDSVKKAEKKKQEAAAGPGYNVKADEAREVAASELEQLKRQLTRKRRKKVWEDTPAPPKEDTPQPEEDDDDEEEGDHSSMNLMSKSDRVIAEYLRKKDTKSRASR